MNVAYFFRKSTPSFHSMEVLFDSIISNLSSANAGKVYLPYKSASPFKLLLNCIYAFYRQTQVNHITGDVNYLALVLTNKRTILTIHDIESLQRSNNLKGFLLRLFWLHLPVKQAKFVTVVSEHSKKQLLKATGIAEDKIKVIPNSVKLEEKDFNPKNSLNKECPLLLQIGTKSNKNLENLVKAITDLPCKLIIIGALSESQLELLKSSRIYYENFVSLPYNGVIELYYKADIVTFVSLYEGFGLPILEANALGRPVITSKAASMPEVAGDSALFVDPYQPVQIREAIIQLIEDDKLRNKLVQAGYLNVQRFKPEEIAAQYEALYKKVIEDIG